MSAPDDRPRDEEMPSGTSSSLVGQSISDFHSTANAQVSSTSTPIDQDVDICRVCRCESSPDKPLFYPCVCTGSIKYIHQDCLVQWLKYSKKEYCELCKHKFSFAPIYHPDMPKRLPVKDIVIGLLFNVLKALRFWLHSTLVAISWMAVVPLTACRIYRCLFAGSVSSLLTLPLDMLSTDNIFTDILQGSFVVLCSLGAFISLVWLREQILSGGGPDWLENQNNNENENQPPPAPQRHQHRPQLPRPQLPNHAPAHLAAVGQQRQQHVHMHNPRVNNMFRNVRNNAIEANNAVGNNDEDDDDQQQEQMEFNNENDGRQQQHQQQQQPQQRQQAEGNDDNHWNPMEWDRAAEDLTWDRLLGLDGSILFLEHVFWVISLNTLFILVFAFFPYHLGHYFIYGLKLHDLVEKTRFDGLVTTLLGYVMLAVVLVFLYTSMAISTFHRSRKIIGLCYIVIKVALLVVTEICIFPLICGIWLDVCSLKLFNSTLNDRISSFEAAPGTSVFVHWLVGMIYVFYFATFVFLLREVFRPGILWFLRNLNDPDFNPVQEMIQLPVFRHIRRFLHSVTLFGFSIVLLFLIPIKLITYATKESNWPILPYNVSQSSETLASELSIELIWLHAVLPALLEQSHMRSWVKTVLRVWAISVAWLLGIRSFLLGDDSNEPSRDQQQQQQQQAPAGANNNNAARARDAVAVVDQANGNPFQFNIGVAHQALLQNNTPFVDEPYVKPSYFKARVVALIVLMCISLLIASIIIMVVPVSIGRWILFLMTGHTKLNEFYTAIAGFYSIWLSIRLLTIFYNWIQMGLFNLFNKFKERIIIVFKSTIAITMLFGIIPVLIGILFQQIVINPISCNLDQTPIMSICQVWALGVLLTKIFTALTLTGPQWWLKQAIERVFQDGFRNINLKFIFTQLFYPIVFCIGMALSLPCIVSRSLAPLIIKNTTSLTLLDRRIYPVSLFIFSLTILFTFQLKQFKRLYERIRNDKYLVGQRLINFERTNQQQSNRPKAD